VTYIRGGGVRRPGPSPKLFRRLLKIKEMNEKLIRLIFYTPGSLLIYIKN
jgi:hypothetical protein